MKLPKYNPSSLPYIGAVASGILLTYAGVECWGAWGWAIGPGVGITNSLSVATASAQIGSITAKGRKRLAYVMLGLLLVVGPATVALSLYAPKTAATAIMWGATADLSIVLAGAIGGKGFVKQDDNPPPLLQVEGKPEQGTGKQGKKKSKRTQPERKQLTDEALLAEIADNPKATQAQLAVIFGVSRQAIGQRLAGLRVPQKEAAK